MAGATKRSVASRRSTVVFGIGPIELLVLAVIGIIPIGALLLVLSSGRNKSDDHPRD